jgi:hypothetical protein
MQRLADEHFEESLRIFIQGDGQMIKTAMSRHAIEYGGEYQPKE